MTNKILKKILYPRVKNVRSGQNCYLVSFSLLHHNHLSLCLSHGLVSDFINSRYVCSKRYCVQQNTNVTHMYGLTLQETLHIAEFAFI
jgi:hypothetical protein